MSTADLLPPDWNLPEIVRQRVGHRYGRQRAIFEDGHLLLILHRLPESDAIGRDGRFFWRNPEGVWTCTDGDGELCQGLDALSVHLDEYAARLVATEKADEAANTATEYFEVLSVLAPVHRAGRNMHQALQQAREHVPHDRDLIDARDRAYEIERTAELLYNDAKNGLDLITARQSEQDAVVSLRMAAASHRLNLLVAFFFPIATFAAVFDTSLRTGLETFDDQYAPLPFFLVLGVGLAFGVILTAFIARQPKR